MALESFMLDAIMGLGGLPDTNVLCLGYPDIFCAPGEWPEVERAKDQDSIKSWHHSTGDILDAESWFKHLGMDLECWDITKARGPEKIVDLDCLTLVDDGRFGCVMMGGESVSSFNQFGLVIDPGTTEHCFNIGQAWLALAAVVAVGGFVIHVNPLNMGNHGFWSINPTAYCDFYEANGFEIMDARIVCGPIADRRFLAPPKSARFDAPENSSMYVVARKLATADLTFPRQKKYRLHPTLKGAA